MVCVILPEMSLLERKEGGERDKSKERWNTN